MVGVAIDVSGSEVRSDGTIAQLRLVIDMIQGSVNTETIECIFSFMVIVNWWAKINWDTGLPALKYKNSPIEGWESKKTIWRDGLFQKQIKINDD